jgi:hypothetical protein
MSINFEEKELTRIKETTPNTNTSSKSAKGFYDMEDQIDFMTNVLKI